MTLASQSYRSPNRRRNMSSNRPLISLRAMVLAGCATLLLLTGWWLLRPVRPAEALTVVPAVEGDEAGEPVEALPPPRVEQAVQPPHPETLRDIVARNEGISTAQPDAPAFTMATRTSGAAPETSPPPPPRTEQRSEPRTEQRTEQRNVPATANADLARAFRIRSNDPAGARLLATRAVDFGTLPRAERESAYELLNALSNQLFYNVNVNPNDPAMEIYTVRSGDTLERIARTRKLGCDHRLLQRLNGIADPRKLRVGQRLRLPKGEFHAEVIKGEYRLNLYLGDGSERVLVSSFRVGLGESNGTPAGLFKVRPDSKLIDPEWTHPRTGQHFRSNDPNNPIGEHWIGLIGVEDRTREFQGYGIHGTIEPESIGQDRSLGCIRMLADDVAVVYECLTVPNSTVLIR